MSHFEKYTFLSISQKREARNSFPFDVYSRINWRNYCKTFYNSIIRREPKPEVVDGHTDSFDPRCAFPASRHGPAPRVHVCRGPVLIMSGPDWIPLCVLPGRGVIPRVSGAPRRNLPAPSQPRKRQQSTDWEIIRLFSIRAVPYLAFFFSYFRRGVFN